MDKAFLQAIDCYVDAHKEEIIKDLRELVEIPSVAQPGSAEPEPFGSDVAKVLTKALDLAERRGMRTENHGNWYGMAKMGTGSHTVGIFSHLDVVETDDRWIYPPFELTIKDGWMIGRGTNDDKIAAVIGFHVAQAMKELGFDDHIELQLFLGCCEEKGMADLDKYLSEQTEPEFSMVPDFIFPVSVSEPGSARFTLTWQCGCAELTNWNCGDITSRIPLKAEVLYTGAFGDKVLSTVNGKEYLNAVHTEKGILIQAKGKNASSFGAADAVNALRVLLSFLATLPILTQHDMQIITSLQKYASSSDGQILGIDCSDPFYGKLSCSCFQLISQEEKISLSYSARIPGNFSPEDILGKLRDFADKNGCAFTVGRANKGSAVNPNDSRVQLINDAWNTVSGKKDKPWSGGGTYAGKLKNAVAFGPKDRSKCEFLPEGHGDLHSPDESLSIRVAMDAVRTYILAFANLNDWYRKMDYEQ